LIWNWNYTQKIRKRVAGCGWAGLVALFCLLLSVTAGAGEPGITNQRVTDVTTRSFSVIGTVSEPSTAVFSLYSSNCTTSVTGYTTTLQQNAASGNMRFTVAGLTAATSYCYQLAVTSTSIPSQTTSATAPVSTATAIERTTTSSTNIVPGGNDILKLPAVNLTAGEDRTAVISSVELLNGTALAPLSLLLSNKPGSDYFNLNNIFAATTGKSLNLVGGERVKITENHGVSGCITERFRTIPADAGGTAARSFTRANPNDVDASGGVNILDILRIVKGKGTTSTGPCFNSDLDLNGDGIIDGADLTIIKGGFNGL
jgi:hypothetical protein